MRSSGGSTSRNRRTGPDRVALARISGERRHRRAEVKAIATETLLRRTRRWRRSAEHPAAWLVPLWAIAWLLGMAILATVIMSLHPHREGIIVSTEWTIENYTRF